jgi:hypothetical protein
MKRMKKLLYNHFPCIFYFIFSFLFSTTLRTKNPCNHLGLTSWCNFYLLHWIFFFSFLILLSIAETKNEWMKIVLVFNNFMIWENQIYGEFDYTKRNCVMLLTQIINNPLYITLNICTVVVLGGAEKKKNTHCLSFFSFKKKENKIFFFHINRNEQRRDRKVSKTYNKYVEKLVSREKSIMKWKEEKLQSGLL